MKNYTYFLKIFVLTVAMIFVGNQNNFVKASEIYIGKMNGSQDVYLLSDSVRTESVSANGERVTGIYCRLKVMLYDDFEEGEPLYEGLDYNYRWCCFAKTSYGWETTGELRGSWVFSGPLMEIEKKILNYILSHYF